MTLGASKPTVMERGVVLSTSTVLRGSQTPSANFTKATTLIQCSLMTANTPLPTSATRVYYSRTATSAHKLIVTVISSSARVVAIGGTCAPLVKTIMFSSFADVPAGE